MNNNLRMADKKLAKKLAKMSEEERTIFLEQQRLAEEESQKKKEEDLFGVLKVRLYDQNWLSLLLIMNRRLGCKKKKKH